ncbi:hypothetical protein CEQ13_12865 [Klebsiella oxytoca]|nr:hypothetical protein CEQ13_12865 [Klebsiella oxytoca]
MTLVSADEPHVLRVRCGCSSLCSRLSATIAPGGIGSEHLGYQVIILPVRARYRVVLRRG